MKLIEQLLDTIAPFACVGCGAEGCLLCAGCSNALPGVPARCYRCNRTTAAYRTCAACCRISPLSAVYARTPYEHVAKTLLHRLKFERAQAAACAIATAMAGSLQKDQEWLITHVPTAPARVRLRGYDQARLIAQEMARLLTMPYIPLLARTTTVRQVGQGRKVRQQQMAHAFHAIHPSACQGVHVLLIDDVITTGATCQAAAAVLRSAGARRVSAAVFAAA